MSRAPGTLWSSFSGSTQPSAETPVRMTSIGWLDAGSASSTRLMGSGNPRSDLSLVLYAFSSPEFGNLPCTSRYAISSNSHASAMSRMS